MKKVLAYVAHITEVERMEKRNEEFQELNEKLVQNTHEGVALVKDGKFEFANQILSDILGYSWEELASKPIAGFVIEEDWKKCDNEAFPTNGQSYFRMLNKDGNLRWLKKNTVQVHWGDNGAVLYTLSDKTNAKKAEEEILTSLEPFRRLVGNFERYLVVF